MTAGPEHQARPAPVPPARSQNSASGAPRRPIGARTPTSMNERRRAQRLRRHTNRSVSAHLAAERLRQDRWSWRRKIRRSPRKLAFYRAVVGVLGTFFICLGIITGPLPGPGGIPLVLLGLAIWASEFHWAHRIMVWFKARLKQYLAWSTRQKVLFWALFAACCGVLIYSYLLVLGPPGWMPEFVRNAVTLLPGV